MNYAIILAGGSGTRFWPLSRKKQPKQFLNLCSSQPMIEETIRRIAGLIDRKNIYIATNKIYEKNIRACLNKLKIPIGNAFFEPDARNTFAPIALLSKKIYGVDRNAVVLVLPSDHYIKEESKCLQAYKKAISTAQKGFIVTIGVKPTHPETGYGYIKIRLQDGKIACSQAYKVERFLEKPQIELAKKFIRDNKYYWNAGMFIFRAQTLLEEIKKLLPAQYKLLQNIISSKDLN
ncbi:MAG: mannose-1-phosphate guanylyltransferase, partial [Candidatus Omnitrophica bacterium]|nr:mannose-1-phosphate guanylyltransferase [Candidatus Omnitrophota bacterium]